MDNGGADTRASDDIARDRGDQSEREFHFQHFELLISSGTVSSGIFR